MRTRSFAILAAGLLALPSAAQEVLPVPPAPVTSAPSAPTAPACGVVECRKTTYQLHWLEREVPATVTTMTPREVTAPCVRTDLQVEFNTAPCVRTELVLKPCETIKVVTCCTQKPIWTTDPCTGCGKIVFEPVTETKLVKEITYQLVPTETAINVRTAFVRPVETNIVRKTMVLDCKTETVTMKERIGVLVPCEITKTKPACPAPCKQ